MKTGLKQVEVRSFLQCKYNDYTTDFVTVKNKCSMKSNDNYMGLGGTLNLDNIRAIKSAMDKIKPTDRSDDFTNYYNEICWRLERLESDDKRRQAKLN